MLVWCLRACSPQRLLLFWRLCVSPLRRPAPRLMSPQRTPKRSHSPYPHPRHGNGSRPPSWTHPQRYCHLWTCLWAHADGVSLTTRNQKRGTKSSQQCCKVIFTQMLYLSTVVTVFSFSAMLYFYSKLYSKQTCTFNCSTFIWRV